jgi:hypothetical protein
VVPLYWDAATARGLTLTTASSQYSGFTVADAGLYRFEFAVCGQMASGGTGSTHLMAIVMVNGNQALKGVGSALDPGYMDTGHVSGLVTLTAGDRVGFSCYVTSGKTVSIKGDGSEFHATRAHVYYRGDA